MTSTDLKNFELGNILNRLFSNGFKSHDEFLTFAYNSWSVYLFPLGLAILLIVLLLVLRLIIRVKRSAKEVFVLLEITPPAITEKSAYTTQELFKTIHGLNLRQTFLDRLIGKKARLSFEIVSTQNQGIRYLIRTTPSLVNTLKRNLYSYLPQGSIRIVNEYLPQDFGNLDNFHSKVVEYKLTKSFGLPLQRQDVLKEHDPVAYITGQMTKLSPGELISLQIILSPTKSREVKVIEQHIKQGDVLEYLNTAEYPLFIRALGGVLKVMINICKEIIGGILSVFQEAGRCKGAY